MSHSAAAARRKLARDVKRQARRKARNSILTKGTLSASQKTQLRKQAGQQENKEPRKSTFENLGTTKVTASKQIRTAEDRAADDKQREAFAKQSAAKEQEAQRVFSATKEKEKEPQGISNVLNTFKAVLTGKDITANVNNIIIKKGLEAAANNPITSALVLTGLGGLIRAGATLARNVIGTLTGGRISVTGSSRTAFNVLENTKTRFATNKLLVGAGFTVGAILVIEKFVGTYPFAKFQISEAMQTIGLARWQAEQADRPDLVEGLDELQREILNPEGWDAILEKIPLANNHKAAIDNIKAAEASRKVFDKIIQDKRDNPEESFEERLTRIRKEEKEMNTAAIKEFNEERKKAFLFEQQALKAAREATRAADRKARNEDAAFWAKERAKQREKEAEDLKAIGDFWIAYRKTIQKIRDNNRPSNLDYYKIITEV